MSLCDVCGKMLAAFASPGDCWDCDGERVYVIRRFVLGRYRPRTVRRGLTYREARDWCRDPETSSTTARGAAARRRTRAYGSPWFDGFAREHGR